MEIGNRIELDSIGLEIVVPSTVTILQISAEVFLIFRRDFMPFHSSVQKILTALFNFVWNTQKNKWTIFFERPGKMFLSIEKVLKKIRRTNLKIIIIIIII